MTVFVCLGGSSPDDIPMLCAVPVPASAAKKHTGAASVMSEWYCCTESCSVSTQAQLNRTNSTPGGVCLAQEQASQVQPSC